MNDIFGVLFNKPKKQFYLNIGAGKMFKILGFARCEDCGKRDLDLVFNSGDAIPLTPEALNAEFSDIVCPECCGGVDATIIILPPHLSTKYLERIQVEYDEIRETPLSFFSEEIDSKKKVEILRTKIFVKLPSQHIPGDIAISSKPFGIYIVEIREGDCMIEARPHIEADGNKNWNTPEWYLVGTEPSEFRKPFQKSLIESRPSVIAEPTNYNFKAYSLLYRLEPNLRKFIFQVFRDKYSEEHGEKWWDAIIPEEIRSQVNQVKEKDSKNPYSQKNLHPVLYATLSHLRDIFDKKWDDFKDLLPNKMILLGDLKKLEYLRNSVAHNRPINKEHYIEVERIGKEIYEWIERAGI